VRPVHIGCMKLADWMAANDITDDRLAAQLDIDRSTASRFRRGKLLPSSAIIAKIAELTSGAVQPNSFFGLPGSHAELQRAS
jgi:transcriptional regulator with XRE-family HTH domain